MLNIIKIPRGYLNNPNINSFRLILLNITMLFFAIGCVKEEKKLDTSEAVKMIIDSIQNKGGYPLSGYLKYRSYPDGIADYSISNFDYLYKKKFEDSAKIVLSKIMKEATTYVFQNDIITQKAELVFTEQVRDTIQEVGIFHVSDLGYYDNKSKALLYFSFMCGQKCGKGYFAKYILNENIWEVEQVLPLWE